MCEFCGSGPECGMCGRGRRRAIPVCHTAAHDLLCGRRLNHYFTRQEFARWVWLGAMLGFIAIIGAAVFAAG